MPSPVARVTGYTRLLVALKALPRSAQVALRGEFRAIGQIVDDKASKRLLELTPQPAKSVAGLKPVVRLRGVEVDQTLRKTTGLRPDWGRTQMRLGLIPALHDAEPEIVAGVAAAMDKATEAVGL